MQITRDMLKEKGACEKGYRDFCQAFPESDYPDGVEYQALLDACAENNKDNYANWLLSSFGRTNDETAVEGDLISDRSIYICGSLKVTGKIKCKQLRVSGFIEAGGSIEAGESIKADESIEAGESIKAGWSIKADESIEAGESIKAGGSIKAGWSIKAGGSIKAGWNCGIYAGLHVKLNSCMRYIKAITRPSNIICGEYIEGDVKR